MAIGRLRRISWLRMLLSVVWACWPALLFYLLVLQTPTLSRTRLILSAVLVLPLAAVAYFTTPRLREALSRRDRTWLLAASGALALVAALGMSRLPAKIYVLTPKHTLQIEPVRLGDGQQVHLNWFSTSLGDVSFDSLPDAPGWIRTGTDLSLTSKTGAALSWTGWTGDHAVIVFSGPRGAVIKASWDGVAKTINFAETGGRAVFGHWFTYPWWTYAALALILWGTIVYLSVVIALGSRIRSPAAALPGWAGWALLAGFVLSIFLLVWSSSPGDLELLLIITLTLLAVAPAHVGSERISGCGTMSKPMPAAGNVLRTNTTLLTVLFSFVLSFALFGRALWSDWSPIDDHEIVTLLGPDGKLPPGEIVSSLSETELGQFGIGGHFRPTFTVLRLAQMSAFGAHPAYYHVVPILLVALAVALFWSLMSRSLGWWGAGLLCAYGLTFPYWGEIGTWLAVGETYTFPGLAVYIWGMREVLRPQEGVTPSTRVAGGLAVLLGAIVCIGSKENFVLLAVPCLYLAYRGARAMNPAAWLPAAVGLLYGAVVVCSLLLALSDSGVDFYGNSMSLSARMGVVIQAIQSPANSSALVTLLVLAVTPGVLLLDHWHDRQYRTAVQWAQFWLVSMALIYLSQLYFYNGAWPTAQRSDFPGMLYIPAAIYVLFGLGLNLVPHEDRAVATRAARTALVIVLFALTIARGYDPIVRFVADYVESTRGFARHLHEISAVLDAHKDYALVVESGRPGDYRWIFAYDRFLRTYGVTNKLFVRIQGYSPETAESAVDLRATSILLQLSEEGRSVFDWMNHVGRSSRRHDPGYSPLRELDAFGPRCFSLSLSGHFDTECQPLE